MAYAVKVNVLDGNLGLQPGSNQNTILIMGCCLGNNAGGGAPLAISNLGDPVQAKTQLVGGELLEAVTYVLQAAPGSIVQTMPLPAATRGGVSSVTKIGTGALAITVTLAPQAAITINCTTTGALGTAAFTFGVTTGGVTVTSPPVVSAASWSTTGYQVPGTYTTLTFTAGSYTLADIYAVSTLGVVTHPGGAGPTSPTFTSSPVDAYSVRINITQSGAVGTSQFTYSLDDGNATSAIITSAASYAIPGTGLVLGFTGTATAGDYYTFKCAPPTFNTTDFTAACAQLAGPLINSFQASMIGVVGSVGSAAAWASLMATAETQALAFNALNSYPRFLIGGPTVGTVLPNNGNVTIDSADTDAIVIAARAGGDTQHVLPAAGDGPMVSAYSGLLLRRNAVWGAIARSAANEASEDIGAVALGGLPGFTGCYRDDFANGLSFYNAGITSLQTYGAGSPVFINRGFTGTVTTSDYYPWTNARVIDQACRIAVVTARPYTLARIPTQTRNGIAGTIREDYAQKIESKMTTAEQAGLPVAPLPVGNAVAVSCQVTRTNNIYSSGQLIFNVAVQPWGYPTQVIVNIGMTLQAA
jgi:hypothetical protein